MVCKQPHSQLLALCCACLVRGADKASCYGVDVSFSAILADRAQHNPALRFWLIELALQHIETDHRMRLARGAGALQAYPQLTYKPMSTTSTSGGEAAKPVPQLTEQGIKRIQWKRQQQKLVRSSAVSFGQLPDSVLCFACRCVKNSKSAKRN